MNKNQKILECGTYKQLLVRFSMPAISIMLVMVLYNITDTFFVGQMGDAGMLSAVSLCTPIFSILSGIGTLFGSGGCTLITLSLGEGNHEQVKMITSLCFLGSVVIGIIVAVTGVIWSDSLVYWLGATGNTKLYAARYFCIVIGGAPAMLFSNMICNVIRGDGSTVQSMAAHILGTIANILLDAWFILVLHWGLEGAALATVIGNIVSCIYLGLYIRKKPIYSLKRIRLLKNGKIVKKTVVLGLPLFCSTMLMSFSGIVSNHILIEYGEKTLAAHSVAGKVGLLISMLAMGICMGLQPAISYAYGKKHYQRIKDIVRKTAILTFVIGFTLSGIGYIFRVPLMYAFINDKEVAAYGSIMAVGSLLAGPVVGWHQLCQTFLQATENASAATMVAILEKGLIYLPVLFIMARVLGFYGVVFASPVTILISFAIGLLLSIQWYRKWPLHNAEDMAP